MMGRTKHLTKPEYSEIVESIQKKWIEDGKD